MIDLDALSFAPHFPSPAQVEYLTIAEELNMVDLKAVALKYYYHAFKKFQFSSHDIYCIYDIPFRFVTANSSVVKKRDDFRSDFELCGTLWKACFHILSLCGKHVFI